MSERGSKHFKTGWKHTKNVGVFIMSHVHPLFKTWTKRCPGQIMTCKSLYPHGPKTDTHSSSDEKGQSVHHDKACC